MTAPCYELCLKGILADLVSLLRLELQFRQA
jgi:hypothetical protein